MKKVGRIIIICSVFISTNCGAQDSILVKGYVSSCKMSSQRIKGATIIAHSSDGLLTEAISDSVGEYKMTLSKRNKYVLTIKNPKDTLPAYYVGALKYNIASSQKFKIDPNDSLNKHEKFVNFCLQEHWLHPNFPDIYFKKNSVGINYALQGYDTINVEDALEMIHGYINDNPQFEFEIRGYCSKDEKDVNFLSLNRANLVYKYVIEKGISTTVVSAKGCGIHADVHGFNKETKEQKRAVFLAISAKKYLTPK